MMGASGTQITWGVLVREALPTLIQSATVTIITLLGYTAMAGTVGGGGLGDLAIQHGYRRNDTDVMVIVVVLIVLIVGAIQVMGDMLSRLAAGARQLFRHLSRKVPPPFLKFGDIREPLDFCHSLILLFIKRLA